MMAAERSEAEKLEIAVAQSLCGYDLEWRDCTKACLAAGRCVGEMNDRERRQARAAIALVVEWCAEEADAYARGPAAQKPHGQNLASLLRLLSGPAQ